MALRVPVFLCYVPLCHLFDIPENWEKLEYGGSPVGNT